jgi:hypothetical protein
VFKARGRNFTLEQTLQAAESRGEVQPFWSRWSREFARANLAHTRREESDGTAVQQLEDDYRYRRNLTTAEECEEWLAARGITVEEFRIHFVRRYWAGRLASAPEHEPSPPAEADEPCARAFRTDLVLSNEFDQMARRLAWRVALSPAADGQQASLSERGELGPSATGQGIQILACNDPAWRRELERMESAFQQECRLVLTLDRRRQELASMRPHLLRLDLEILELDSEAAAREAFLCAKQDGISLAELAAEQGYPLRQEQPLLEELPSPCQTAFLGACPGAVLPPAPMGERFRVCRLKSKAEPGLSDPGVQQRVDAGILGRHFLELELRHVRWHMAIDEAA